MQAVAYAEEVSSHVHRVILAISQDVVRQEHLQVDDPDAALPVPVVPAVPEWKGLITFGVPSEACRWYGDNVVRTVLSWFWFVLTTSTAPVKWVSHFQLYIDYMGSTGHPGPVKDKPCFAGILIQASYKMVYKDSQRKS